MSTNTMIGRDMYIRTTQPNGKSSVSMHRVWDAQRFITAQQREAADRASKDKTAPDIVSTATADEYIEQHTKRR